MNESSSLSLPSPDVLKRNLGIASSVMSFLGGVLVVIFLYPVLHFTNAQVILLGWTISAYMIPLGLISFWRSHTWLAGIIGFLEKGRAGEESDETEVHQAFADAIDYPRKLWIYNLLCYLVGALLFPAIMLFNFDVMTWFTALLMTTGALISGLLTQSFIFISLKMILSPVRDYLATQIEDPQTRRELVVPVGLPPQLFIAMMSLSIFMAVYSIFLVHGRSMSAMEGYAIQNQSRILERIAERQDTGEELTASLEWAEEMYSSFGVSVLLLDPNGEQVLHGDEGLLHAEEIAELRFVGIERGDSLRFDSGNSFCWMRVGAGGPILVMVTASEVLGADNVAAAWTVFGIMALAIILSMCFAGLASQDLKRSMNQMLARVRSIASGELRGGAVFESENELGELGRAVDMMRHSLHETVQWILTVSDEAESVASDVASSTTDIVDGSTRQLSNIEQVKGSVEGITQQVGIIASSTSALTHDVESSSGAALELQAVAGSLKDNAGDLSQRAEESSSSIDQMLANLNQIAENTETLARSVDDVSSSITEMASQVHEVEINAEETAKLSERVIEAADVGRERVQETIEGMETIREATMVAEEAVRHLTERNSDIGSIISVIDDVADETNLLALNAAIIAAQAGENGKAFSVVADEIKELADRVTANTQEISGLIKGLQQESDHAVSVIGRGAMSVKRGVDLTAEAGSSLEQITDAARASGGHIAEIVGAFKEHAQTSHQLVGLMESVREGVQGIRSAGQEQRQGSSLVRGSAVNVDEIARQVRCTAEEQDRGSVQIAKSMTSIKDEVNGIHNVLQEQNERCVSVRRSLVDMQDRAEASEHSARATDEAMGKLLKKFQALRKDVQSRFEV